MRTTDLLGMALAALWQQKGRTALTLLGVLLGTCMLAVSLSLGQGLQELATAELTKDDRLRKVGVHPGYSAPAVDESAIPPEEIKVVGNMSEEKRQRLRQFLVAQWQRRQPATPNLLTDDKLAALAALEHVAAVEPEYRDSGELSFNGRQEPVGLTGGKVDAPQLAKRLVAGRMPGPAAREALVSELTLFRWGITDDADVERLLGRPARLTVPNDQRSPYLVTQLLNLGGQRLGADESRMLTDLLEQLPAALERIDLPPAQKKLLDRLKKLKPETGTGGPREVAGEITLVGVLRGLSPEEVRWSWWERGLQDDMDLILPHRAAGELLGGLPRYKANGVHFTVVTVDSERNVRAVADAIKGMGLTEFSMVEVAERVYQEVLLIRTGMVVLSVLALVVAGLGITNTMVTSVLERTRDIGIMKAVGARDRQVLVMFLVEGAVLGLLGGALGLAAAGLLSVPAEGWMHSVIENQAQTKIERAVFLFPAWLLLGAPVFASLVTTVAAALPARRASRVDPVVALRTE
jgi:putative ABC transport system permease protein